MPKETSILSTSKMLEVENEQVEEEFKTFYSGRFKGELPHQALAISGGGIRSGSFAMGVMQALHNRNLFGQEQATLLERMRYLSTVSGGGYTGSALSWYQRKYGFFPFGEINTFIGSQLNPDSIKKNEAELNFSENDQSNHILNYIRQHGSYLTPPGLGFLSLLVSVIRSVLTSSIAYMLLLALFFLGVFFFSNIIIPDHHSNWLQSTTIFQLIQNFSADSNGSKVIIKFLIFNILLALVSAVLWLIITIIYSLSSATKRFFAWAYVYRVQVQAVQGVLAKLLAVGLIVSILPVLSLLLYGNEMELHDGKFTLPASLSTIAVIMTTFSKLRGHIESNSAASAIYNTLVVSLFILLLMLASFEIARLSHNSVISMVILLFAAIIFGVIVNINQVSPHKMYRDRLMATFMKAPEEPIRGDVSKRGLVANKSLLKDLNHSEYWSPYHLINCNLILVDSPTPKFKGRLGDSFLLSSKYCGSDATGYMDTQEFENGNMTLATAFSISGAAIDPNTGSDGNKGEFSNSVVSFLMTFLGARLGYWCYNPATTMAKHICKVLRPNYAYPGLRSLAGGIHSEDATAIELSDGGHFDNLGLYELIRRRVPLIFVSDGGSDPDFDFDSLGSVMSKARVDFNTEISFKNKEYDLDKLLPGSRALNANGEPSLLDAKYDLSVRGYALAEIEYPALSAEEPARNGILVYIKSVMTGDLPVDLYAYKAANTSFPFQPTSDQFFNERQMESYRELGYMLTRQLIKDKQAMNIISSGHINGESNGKDHGESEV